MAPCNPPVKLRAGVRNVKNVYGGCIAKQGARLRYAQLGATLGAARGAPQPARTRSGCLLLVMEHGKGQESVVPMCGCLLQRC